jgi:hypothetical protein
LPISVQDQDAMVMDPASRLSLRVTLLIHFK